MVTTQTPEEGFFTFKVVLVLGFILFGLSLLLDVVSGVSNGTLYPKVYGSGEPPEIDHLGLGVHLMNQIIWKSVGLWLCAGGLVVVFIYEKRRRKNQVKK